MLKQYIEFINQQIQTTRQMLQQISDSHHDLKQQEVILKSIPAVGEALVPALLPLLSQTDKFNSKNQLTAFVGLSLKQRRSGSSVHYRDKISKVGCADIRKALYMPALVAYSRVKVYQPFVHAWLLLVSHPKSLLWL